MSDAPKLTLKATEGTLTDFFKVFQRSVGRVDSQWSAAGSRWLPRALNGTTDAVTEVEDNQGDRRRAFLMAWKCLCNLVAVHINNIGIVQNLTYRDAASVGLRITKKWMVESRSARTSDKLGCQICCCTVNGTVFLYEKV